MSRYAVLQTTELGESMSASGSLHEFRVFGNEARLAAIRGLSRAVAAPDPCPDVRA